MTLERAQDTFKRMMQEAIAPALRELGFKGSGQSYTYPSETHWAQLGFQKSAYGDSGEVSFTINVSVISKRDWDQRFATRPGYSVRPAANTGHGVGWHERIGLLLPAWTDLWWSVPAGRPTTGIANEAIAAVRDYALPEMKRQIAGAPDARPSPWLRET